MALEASSTVELIVGLVATISAGSSVWFWYDRKRRDKRLDQHQQKIEGIHEAQVRHSVQFVQERQVREITRDEMAPLKESHSEVKSMMLDLSAKVMAISTSQEVQTQILKQVADSLQEMRNDYKANK